jgi:peptide deformylase
MATRTIVYSEDPILREKSTRIRRVTPDVEELIADMFETMRTNNGVGLAAVQVGVPLRVIVVEIPEELEDPEAGTSLALINPELARSSDEVEDGIEGCLSVPGWVGEVERHSRVTVKAMDERGKKIRVRASGYLARVLQHEIDHLNGVLFIDLAKEMWPVTEGEEETAEAHAASEGAAGIEAFLE